MTEQQYKDFLKQAEMLYKNDEKNQLYWNGFIYGLRRGYYGKRFGTDEEHDRRLKMIKNEDPDSIATGYGYRDGLTAVKSGENPWSFKEKYPVNAFSREYLTAYYFGRHDRMAGKPAMPSETEKTAYMRGYNGKPPQPFHYQRGRKKPTEDPDHTPLKKYATRLPVELIDALKSESDRLQIPQSKIVTDAVEEKLKKLKNIEK